MVLLYNPGTEPEQCPSCGGQMAVFNYDGVKIGCTECMPDGLVDAYAMEDNA